MSSAGPYACVNELHRGSLSASIFHVTLASPSQHPVEVQEQNGAADRDRQAAEVETRHVAESQLGSDKPADQCPRDTEYSRDDDPAGVSAGHEKFGQYTRNQPEHDP